ncbi:MAG: MFS transporter, partial [Lamprobacter sp.]|uniref:MFS transporter n=1 Tax=Lamprobacter sp. TaxID=3100796 RepID=UPI002B25BEF0
AVARAFRRHRGKAVSLVAAGFPVAEAIAPILVVAVAAALGWRTTWWLIAGLLILLAGVLLALLGRHVPERPSLEAGSSGEPAPWTRAQVLRDRRFYLILPALMGAPFIATAVFFHQVPLAESKGWTLAWLAASFPAFAAAHLLSLSFSGPLIDRLGARRLLPWHLTPLLLALLALALANGPWLAP